MKKTPTEEQPSDAWAQALVTFDRDLRRRGAAEKTRRAYAIDLGQFARWAGGRGLAPEVVGTRDLRRYAAALSEHGGAPSTVARKIASLRSFYRSLVEHGRVQQNPADLLTAPKRRRRLPRTLKPSEVARLLDRVPTSTPLELRDRALFELAYASGLRAEELVNLDVASLDYDDEQVRVEGKGGKTRIVPVGEPALNRAARLRRARAPRARTLGRRTAARSRRCFCPSPGGGSPPPTCADGCACGPATRPCRPGSRRTGCGTHSPLTFWREEPICGRFRSFWAHASLSTTQVYTQVESARLRTGILRSHPRA